MGLRFRFACVISLITLCVLISFSALIFSQIRENSLKSAESYLKELTQHEWEHLDLPSHQNPSHQEPQHYKHIYLQIWKNGYLSYNTFPIEEVSIFREGLDLQEKKVFYALNGIHGGESYEIRAYYDLTLILEHLVLIKRNLLMGCLAALLFMIPLSWVTAKILLQPFARLASETSTLTAQQLSFRLKESSIEDEYGLLVKNFNLLFDRLEKSFSKVRNFAVNASHEMRTPLAVIVSQLERVLRSHPQEVESVLPFCERSFQAALQLRNITNHLFLLSEAERLGEQNSNNKFQIDEVIETALSNVRETQQNMKKNIEWKKNSEGLTPLGNSALALSVVSNLLENALKFSKDLIRLECILREGEVVLRVEDDGPGISPETRGQVFQPFYKEKHKTKESNPGHGLGLAIVEACVRALKGRVTLGESQLGGLLVEVALPTS